MSTTIENGFRIDGLDPVALSARIALFRGYVIRETPKLLSAVIAEDVARIVDGRREGWERPYLTALRAATAAMEEIRVKRIRHPRYDFEFSLSFIPDEADGCWYGMVFSDRREWTRRWMRAPGVTSQSYWNGSDRPDRMRKAEWERRERLWDRILPTGVAAESMWHVDLGVRFPDVTPEKVLRAMPDMTTRTRRMTGQIATDERYREIAGGADFDVSKVMEADAWSRTPEGERRRSQIAATLDLRPITKNTLLGEDT